MSDRIHICYCFDKDYEQHAAVSIISLVKNSKLSKLVIHIISDSFSENFKSFIKELMVEFNINYHFYLFDLKKLEKLKRDIHKYVSHFAYSKIFIPDLVYKNTEKVIYLDADTVVLDDLTDFFSLDLGDKFIGAALDYSNEYMKKIHCIDDYFNSGVMLINVKSWNEKKLLKKIVDYGISHNKKIIAGDQCLINLFFNKKIKLIDQKFNTFVLSSSGQHSFTKKNATILHYITHLKPWQSWFNNINQESYNYYLALTPWCDQKLFQPVHMSEWKHLAYYLLIKDKNYELSLKILKECSITLKKTKLLDEYSFQNLIKGENDVNILIKKNLIEDAAKLYNNILTPYLGKSSFKCS